MVGTSSQMTWRNLSSQNFETELMKKPSHATWTLNIKVKELNAFLINNKFKVHEVLLVFSGWIFRFERFLHIFHANCTITI